ncbi:MAG: TVP38/TMEM64 family protein [Desulfovibrionaceae bacterium]
MTKKILLAAVIAALFTAFFLFDLGQYFTLAYVKASQARFTALYAGNPLPVLGGFMLLYILVSALALPAAAPVLSLAGAAVFGFWPTLAAVSFASTIGATLACMAARYLLRGFVERTFAATIAKINANIATEGPFYLFTLRLVPLFPFFAINLAMGLTAMRLRTFYWVSQVGMLAGTAAYVNAGTELGHIESLSGILSPGVLVSFAILGVFPLAAKKMVAAVRVARTRKAAATTKGEKA